MGGCASGQHAAQGPDNRALAEWSALYERRIADALPNAAQALMTQGEGTQEDAVALDTMEDGSLAAHRLQSIDDVPLEREPLPTHHMQTTGESLPVHRDQSVDDEQQNQTIVFFDWDDTLFPTTWARKHLALRSGQRCPPTIKEEHEEWLKQISLRMLNLLGKARMAGKVVIITNASRSWVAGCRSMLLPEVRALLQRIPVIHAMELMTSGEMSTLPTKILYTEPKARAMRSILSTFLKTNRRFRGWINIVSIGDSECERVAVREVTRGQLGGSSASHRYFTKTVKMLGRPCLMQMLVQIAVISKWLAEIAHSEMHVNIDLGEHAN